MAIVLRITSADGKRSIMKTLPGLPARIQVAPGARIEVIDPETKRVESLALYVNRHANQRDDDGERHASQVTVETVADWAATEAWLNSVGEMAVLEPSDPNWFYTGEEDGDGEVLGLEKNTLFIAGLLGIGLGGGAYALGSGGNGPKDDIAPAAPRLLDLAAADDNGSSTTDNITSLTSGLTITGLAEAGANVQLFDGTTSLGSAKADAGGAFTLDVSLAEGVHTVTAKATDSAGNVSTESTALTVTVDKTAPAAATELDLATADDTGSSTSDNITNRTTGLSISGTVEANTVVELFNGTTSLGTAIAGANGVFTKDISLAAGTHAITVKATDAAGNVGIASEALTIVVDTAAPTVPTGLDLDAADDTGSSDSDNVTSKLTELTLRGSAEAGSSVELFDGTTSLGTATVGVDGTFSKDVTLAAGTHSITARSFDTAGNVSLASAALSIIVDATVSSLSSLDLAAVDDTGISSADNITNRTTGLTITGTAEAGSTVELFDGTSSLGSTATGAGGVFSRDISLAAGQHAITAVVTDRAGNASPATAPLVVNVDTVAPAAPAALNLDAADDSGSSNTDNVTSRTSGLSITGNAEANSLVELFAGSVSLGTATATSNGVFGRDIALSDGTYLITAKSTDTAGNVSVASDVLTVIVDTEAPAPPAALDLSADDDDGTSSSDNVTSRTSALTITGTAEANSVVEIFDGATSLGTIAVSAQGTFSKDISLGVGDHSITAKATDAAGNFGSASAVLNINVVSIPASQALSVDEYGETGHSGINHFSLLDSSTSFA